MHRRIALWALLASGCNDWGDEPDPYDLDFDIPRSETFAPRLSAYGLYQAPADALQPAPGTVVYELSSELYSDYASKQRLLKLPEGAAIGVEDGALAYPEGTVMAKTFYYPDDMGQPEGGRRILETRLLVRTDGVWNVATYLWNEAQTEATLLLGGTTTDVSWVDDKGERRGTTYAVPHEGECVTCHQADGESVFIGPTLRNLNREVIRGGEVVNQLEHLVAAGMLEPGIGADGARIPNHKDTGASLEERARAYLDLNCAHCHRPGGWDEAEQPELDFRYETALDETGLVRKADDLERQLENGEMPFLGTTLLHDEGVRLVLEYVGGL